MSLRNNENVRLHVPTQKIHLVQHPDSYHRSVTSCCRGERAGSVAQRWSLGASVAGFLGTKAYFNLGYKMPAARPERLRCSEPTLVPCARLLEHRGPRLRQRRAPRVSIDPSRAWCKREYGVMIVRPLTGVTAMVLSG